MIDLQFSFVSQITTSPCSGYNLVVHNRHLQSRRVALNPTQHSVGPRQACGDPKGRWQANKEG